jgi:hypothetical protein
MTQTAPEPLLAFVHIPRTGGGTVKSAIQQNYERPKSPGNYQSSPENTRRAVETLARSPGRWRAAADHIPLALYQEYLPAETRYLTVLREPVDRVLSHYHQHAQAGNPPGSRGARRLRSIWKMVLTSERWEGEGADADEVVLEDDVEFSLEEGLRRKICLYDNFQTRFLWGGEFFGDLPAEALERAKENISRFWFVGISERLDESLVLLGRKLGIGPMAYHLKHVSKRRPPLEETSGELRDLIVEHNNLDVELYAFARARFDEEAPAPEELAADVEELRRRSAEVTEAGDAARIDRKESYKAAKRAGKQQLKQERLAAAETDLEGALAERLAVVEERLARIESQLAGVAGNGAEVESRGAKLRQKPRSKVKRDAPPQAD